MEPGRIPFLAASSSMRLTLACPSGTSQRTCKAMVGHTPVSLCTWPASENFSSMHVAAPGCTNFPKRVPVFENPHEGSSIRKASSALQTRRSLSFSGKKILLSSNQEDLTIPELAKWISTRQNAAWRTHSSIPARSGRSLRDPSGCVSSAARLGSRR